MTDEVTEIPRCCSSRIQSEVAWRAALRPLTVPAIWMAPPNSSSFSVSVVLPASGCEMIANVRRRAISGGIVVGSAGTACGITFKSSGLDQFQLSRLEPDLMEFCRLAEGFPDVQLDEAVVHLDDGKRLAD